MRTKAVVMINGVSDGISNTASNMPNFQPDYVSADATAVLLSRWQNVPYAELSIIVSWLKVLSSLHQSHHWQSKADPFYGDHQMFERLYIQTNESIDKVAEKAVGMGCSELVDPDKLFQYASEIFYEEYQVRPGIPQPIDLVSRSLHLENRYLKVIEMMSDSLESKCLLSKGVDNMLAGLADEAEGRVYLLKQRLAF